MRENRFVADREKVKQLASMIGDELVSRSLYVSAYNLPSMPQPEFDLPVTVRSGVDVRG